MKHDNVHYTMPLPRAGWVGIVVTHQGHGGSLNATHTYLTHLGFVGMDVDTRQAMLVELEQRTRPVDPTTVDTSEPLTAHGVKVIGDMSRDELLAEIRVHQEAAVSSMDDNELKHHVIRMRAQEYLGRLHNEARFDPPPFGFPGFGHE